MLLPRFADKKTKYILTLCVVTIFVLISFNINNQLLKTGKDLKENITNPQQRVSAKTYQGKVVFVEPSFYPDDQISFKLVDDFGNKKVLLKAVDDRLVVVEGLNVELSGSLTKTLNKKEDVLIVEEVVVKN